MRKLFLLASACTLIISFSFSKKDTGETSWIRINLLGYQTKGSKVAVWCSKEYMEIKTFQLINAETKKIAFNGSTGKAFGSYGPFTQTYRLNFSNFNKPGRYYLQSGGTKSPVFEIGNDVYKGTADFCLRYMRQQRTGFNPFLKDSCHTDDGYVLYGEEAGIPDSTYIDVVGGWHDASDYLQYSTTSANATYHLLAAYRDFPNAFTDEKLANGLEGKNGMADILDEARWGLDWLLKMHPKEDWMFNQIADDRDHMGMRIPGMDTFYGRGSQRPVYFINGEPQQRGKFLNNTTGTTSTAAKFASAFALGSEIFINKDPVYAFRLQSKSASAFQYSIKKPGVTQTASVKAPYIYAEENWVDDLELAIAQMANSFTEMEKSYPNKKVDPFPLHSQYQDDVLNGAYLLAQDEPITPWMGDDTARHYQWYPFINLGHYELAKQLKDKRRDTIIGFYKEGIERVWNKAKHNAFYRGVPFIWCSNNLTTSFAIQCYWYKQLTADKQFEELEQASFDWLFGCNPWGTSMVYGLPSHGDTPVDPHSAFTHLGNYPIDGGLVDGPVYTSIYKNLIGIKLYNDDEYAPFQSDLAVYHDDYGDYSTNEPTMDGTASLIYLLAAKDNPSASSAYHDNNQRSFNNKFSFQHGGIVRGDKSSKRMALIFTGHDFADGGWPISKTLAEHHVKASFFFTGDFYNRQSTQGLINALISDGHYLGNHGNAHILYCDWTDRNKLLVTKKEFLDDLLPLKKLVEQVKDRQENDGIKKPEINYFIPPYEWYNDSISKWSSDAGFQLINFTSGTLSHADYTTPLEKNYRSSGVIYQSILDYENKTAGGLNGFILLMHIGTDPDRTDKFYHKLPELLQWLKSKGYVMVRVDELLGG